MEGREEEEINSAYCSITSTASSSESPFSAESLRMLFLRATSISLSSLREVASGTNAVSWMLITMIGIFDVGYGMIIMRQVRQDANSF